MTQLQNLQNFWSSTQYKYSKTFSDFVLIIKIEFLRVIYIKSTQRLLANLQNNSQQLHTFTSFVSLNSSILQWPMFTGDTTWWFVFFPLFPTLLMLSLTFYYIWIRPSCCPYLERREAEKYLESVVEAAHDNQTYANINAVVGISPGLIFIY